MAKHPHIYPPSWHRTPWPGPSDPQTQSFLWSFTFTSTSKYLNQVSKLTCSKLPSRLLLTVSCPYSRSFLSLPYPWKLGDDKPNGVPLAWLALWFCWGWPMGDLLFTCSLSYFMSQHCISLWVLGMKFHCVLSHSNMSNVYACIFFMYILWKVPLS